VKTSPRDIEMGIRQTRWPGRFQIIAADPQQGCPEIILDVAHNPAGAWALRAALSERYFPATDAEGNGGRPLTFVFGAMSDKAIAEIAEILFPLAAHLVVTRASIPRSASAEEICALAHHILAAVDRQEPVGAAVEHACGVAGPNGVVVITGSIYVVGEAMAALQDRLSRPS